MANFSDSSDDEDALRSLEMARSPSQEDLLPLLECPVCFDLPLPPIRTCLQGHIICADCCTKLTACPLCLKPIGYGRNFFAEDYINKSIMICMYRDYGCPVELTGDRIKAHTSTCDYRPLKCQHCRGANRRVTFAAFQNHLFTAHNISRWDLTDEGDRVVEVEKLQASQNNQGVQPARPNKTPSIVIKSLFGLAAALFLTDQIRSALYPEDLDI